MTDAVAKAVLDGPAVAGAGTSVCRFFGLK